jgi:hypothetical protein
MFQFEGMVIIAAVRRTFWWLRDRKHALKDRRALEECPRYFGDLAFDLTRCNL